MDHETPIFEAFGQQEHIADPVLKGVWAGKGV